MGIACTKAVRIAVHVGIHPAKATRVPWKSAPVEKKALIVAVFQKIVVNAAIEMVKFVLSVADKWETPSKRGQSRSVMDCPRAAWLWP